MKCKLMLVDSVVSGSAVAETIVLLQKHKNKAKGYVVSLPYHRRDSTATINVLVNSQSKRLRMTGQRKNLLI